MWKFFKRSDKSMPADSVSAEDRIALEKLSTEIDRLSALIDSFEDMRKQVSRIERKVYRSNGHNDDEPVPVGDDWFKDLK